MALTPSQEAGLLALLARFGAADSQAPTPPGSLPRMNTPHGNSNSNLYQKQLVMIDSDGSLKRISVVELISEFLRDGNTTLTNGVGNGPYPGAQRIASTHGVDRHVRGVVSTEAARVDARLSQLDSAIKAEETARREADNRIWPAMVRTLTTQKDTVLVYGSLPQGGGTMDVPFGYTFQGGYAHVSATFWGDHGNARVERILTDSNGNAWGFRMLHSYPGTFVAVGKMRG